ncbi:unnamed protein product [Vitrella brassicaformis CCMP3155]|uniref:EF-hand domain-containing protein n=1 Tax=Vitrella brassicaformis (strain CCMP3155) TaxID=1169540 RepID=A0A0G4EA40_VITBC|nr:unnamed protein product [Vitrella brassicaformis CCMP3155]|eukprot:CEL92812.1 unnamed protein product [Vitrella brassicaformis CCMP3155]
MSVVPQSRTEKFTNIVSRVDGDDGTRIVQLLKSWDKNGDGTFTAEEVAEAARQLTSERKHNKTLRWALIGMGVGWIITLVIVFVLVLAGVEVMKDIKVDGQAVVIDRGTKHPARMAEALERFALPDFYGQPLRDFEKLETLVIPTGEESEGLFRVSYVLKEGDEYKLHLEGDMVITLTKAGYTLTDADGKEIVAVEYEKEKKRQLQETRVIGRDDLGSARFTRCGPYPCAEVIGERPFYRPLARPFPSFT